MARWKDRPHDLKEIGGQLKADVVLEGNVRRSGDQVRIMAQLVDAKSGFYLWSETYSRQMRDILAIQEEIAQSIVAVLKLRLTPARAAVVIRQPDTEAYHLYLKGRYHWNKRTFEGLNTSAGLFEEAIAKDANCAPAFAGLADAFSLMVEFGFLRTDEGMPRAKAAALRALELDNTLAEAHVSLAYILSIWDWQWRDAEIHYLRALELNPSYAGARHWYAIDFLALLGRLDEADEQMQIASRLDPLSFLHEESAGYLMMMKRDYEGAVRQYCRLQALAPEFHRAYTTLGRAYAFLGRYDDAIAQLHRGLELAGELPSIFAALGQIYGMAGRRRDAEAMMQRLIDIQPRRSVSPTCFAIVHLGLGEHDAALTQLELACERRQLPITVINVHPLYDPLRNEPRFQAIIERVGFAAAAKAR
jgi:serine/threonine-protein kinase